MKLQSGSEIRLLFILRSTWRALVWLALEAWHFEERHCRRKPEPVPASIAGIRATLAHTDKVLADISEILDAGRSKNELLILQCWLQMEEQKATLQAALDTALADEARHTQPLAA